MGAGNIDLCPLNQDLFSERRLFLKKCTENRERVDTNLSFNESILEGNQARVSDTSKDIQGIQVTAHPKKAEYNTARFYGTPSQSIQDVTPAKLQKQNMTLSEVGGFDVKLCKEI